MTSALRHCEAVLFDLDGVLTPTADIHRLAWRTVFTEVFAELGILPPYADADYFEHLDGKPRYPAVADLLRARGVDLPWGDPSDPPEARTVCGIGNRKNEAFQRSLAAGVTPYRGSVALLDALDADGVPMAVVSSSRNAPAVLRAAALAERFEVVVDGASAAALGLAGKPAPDTFLHAARLLGAVPAASAVVEDAVQGVAAAAAGGFGLVVGVDRGAGAAALAAAGAGIVVDDLARLVQPGEDGRHA